MTYFLTQDKLYLYVPFSQKEEAKEKGAKYDPDLKLWYLPPVKDPLDVLEFWSFLENTYEDRDQLKRMGAKFHPKMKKWFVPNTCKNGFEAFIKWWPENLKRFVLLDKYIIYHKINRGGQADVYRALDIEDKSVYAIKIFNVPEDEIDTKKKKLDFQKEMSALEKLSSKNHKNIISYKDFGQIEETGQYFIVTDFYEYNLDKYINNSDTGIMEDFYDIMSRDYELELSKEEFIKEAIDTKTSLSDKEDVRDIMFPILEGLVFCHKNNIYHRDVTPNNICIDFSMDDFSITPKLIDFGISKNIINQSSNTLTRVYMHSKVWAPENVNALDEIKLQHTRDIYGWAATTISFINKKMPEDDEELRSMLKSTVAKKFDKEFIKLLKYGIEKKASNRPQDILEYKEKIANVLFK